jgi:fatty-acyl-CoA synthase
MESAFTPAGLAFSTLGAPAWSIVRVAEAVAEFGYDGIELRLLDGAVIDAQTLSAEAHNVVTAVLKKAGVPVACYDSSVRLTMPDTYPELRASLQLAHDLEAPLVRVFGGRPHPETLPAWSHEEIGNRIAPLLDDAESLGVSVALETHDFFSSAASVAALLDHVSHPRLGVVWDVRHTWGQGESPEDAVAALGDRILFVHVKDALNTPDGPRLCLLGEGEVPVPESLSVLRRAGYTGWISVEWEKYWHPELDEPEIALPQHAKLLREWFETA